MENQNYEVLDPKTQEEITEKQPNIIRDGFAIVAVIAMLSYSAMSGGSQVSIPNTTLLPDTTFAHQIIEQYPQIMDVINIEELSRILMSPKLEDRAILQTLYTSISTDQETFGLKESLRKILCARFSMYCSSSEESEVLKNETQKNLLEKRYIDSLKLIYAQIHRKLYGVNIDSLRRCYSGGVQDIYTDDRKKITKTLEQYGIKNISNLLCYPLVELKKLNHIHHTYLDNLMMNWAVESGFPSVYAQWASTELEGVVDINIEKMEERYLYNIVIEDLDLSVRLYRILEKNNFKNLGEIISVKRDNLQKLKGMGKETMKELDYLIEEKLPDLFADWIVKKKK